MCDFCRNAFCDPTLNHDNDFLFFRVGDEYPGYFISIRSSHMQPLAIVFTDCTDRGSVHNMDVEYYFPKFCPECGRKITERELLLKKGCLFDTIFRNPSQG